MACVANLEWGGVGRGRVGVGSGRARDSVCRPGKPAWSNADEWNGLRFRQGLLGAGARCGVVRAQRAARARSNVMQMSGAAMQGTQFWYNPSMAPLGPSLFEWVQPVAFEVGGVDQDQGCLHFKNKKGTALERQQSAWSNADACQQLACGPHATG